jgi:hypothetical protein
MYKILSQKTHVISGWEQHVIIDIKIREILEDQAEDIQESFESRRRNPFRQRRARIRKITYVVDTDNKNLGFFMESSIYFKHFNDKEGTGYWRLLRGSIVQSVPCTAAVF